MLNKKNTATEREILLHSLLIAAAAGNKAAYASFLREAHRFATAYVLRKLGQRQDTDDVVQEILISLDKALPTFDASRPCMPWIAAIMHYRLSDWMRKQYTASRRDHVPIEDMEAFLCSPDVTDAAFEYEYVKKAVATLSEGQQAVLHAMYQEELSVLETSAKLGLSESAVKVTAHRAYKTLRKRLEGA